MNRDVKQVRIFVYPHIYKILRRDHGYDGKLVLPRRFQLIGHTNPLRWKKWETPQEKSKEIIIEGPNMNLHKAYFIIRSIESEFREKMNTYVLGATKGGMPSRAALREFIEVYDILEEELKLDSCYKDWSRFKGRNHRRGQIPLWL
jgi:hypothetical protein